MLPRQPTCTHQFRPTLARQIVCCRRTCINSTQKCCAQSLSHGSGAVCGPTQQCCWGFSELSCFDNRTQICCPGVYGLPCPKRSDKCGGTPTDPQCIPKHLHEERHKPAAIILLGPAPYPHHTYRVEMKVGKPGKPSHPQPFGCASTSGNIRCSGVACSNGCVALNATYYPSHTPPSDCEWKANSKCSGTPKGKSCARLSTSLS
eukprot:SAG31_NODE_520_length_14616_cov_8.879005_6_plen_204_part_00